MTINKKTSDVNPCKEFLLNKTSLFENVYFQGVVKLTNFAVIQIFEIQNSMEL